MNASPDIAAAPVRILIVDDDPGNREVFEIVLSREGYLIATAASGDEALALVAQQPPALILLDIMMPDMSGYQLLAKLKGNPATKHIRVLMITALNDRATKLRALSAGADGFLIKPVDRAELCGSVRRLSRLETPGHVSENAATRFKANDGSG